MKTASTLDRDFRNQLRTELLKQQDRRAEHVKSKFTFIVALGGLAVTLQSLRFSTALTLNLLIYSIPLVAALFDLYILGGEFSVKRIRCFLMIRDVDHTQEAAWAEFVDTWPKDFMRRNRAVATGLVDVACVCIATANLIKFRSPALQWVLFAAWCVLIGSIYIYLLLIERRMRALLSRASESTTRKIEADAGGTTGPKEPRESWG